MAWQKTNVSQERIKFVVLASRKEQTVAELCREFGISRQTGHTWLKRYQQAGVSGIYERSRKPHHSPNQTSQKMVDAVVALRQRWPDWGALKLHHKLAEQHPEWAKTGVSTLHQILLRNHLVAEPGSPQACPASGLSATLPNELWQMDFKGRPGFNKGRGTVVDSGRSQPVFISAPAIRFHASRRSEKDSGGDLHRPWAAGNAAGRSRHSVVERRQQMGVDGADGVDHAAGNPNRLQRLSSSANAGQGGAHAWSFATGYPQAQREIRRTSLAG